MPRWLYESPEPIMAPVDAAQAVAALDLVATDAVNGEVYRAEDQAFNASEAQTRTDFVTRFLGAAAQDKAAGARVKGNTSDEIRVDTAGIFEYELDAPASFDVGDRFGPAFDGGSNKLKSRVLKPVTPAGESIGVAVEAGTNATKVKVRMHSTLAPLAKP